MLSKLNFCRTVLLIFFIVAIQLGKTEICAQGWSQADFGSPYLNRLYWSIEDDNVEVVKQYLKEGWPIEKRASALKITIFSYAASVGAVKVVKFLISKGSDVNSRSGNNITPIMYTVPDPGASESYNSKKLQVFNVLLHNYKVDLSAKNGGGKTVLDIAMLFGQMELAKQIKKELKIRRS
jgi:ankyrin repeat protein